MSMSNSILTNKIIKTGIMYLKYFNKFYFYSTFEFTAKFKECHFAGMIQSTAFSD